MKDQPDTHWDPFWDTIPARRDQFTDPGKQRFSPLQKGLLGFGVLGVLMFLFGKGLFGSMLVSGLGALILFPSFFAFAYMKKERPEPLVIAEWALGDALAQKVDWSFRLIQQEESRLVKFPRGSNHVLREDIEKAAQNVFGATRPDLNIPEDQIDALAQETHRSNQDRTQITFLDPYLFRFIEGLRPFLMPTATNPLPLRPGVMYWGHSDQKVPFFLALSIRAARVVGQGNGWDKDSFSSLTNASHSTQFLVALPLQDDTKVSALITQKPLSGDHLKRLTLPASEFNTAFTVQMDQENTKPGVDGAAIVKDLLGPEMQQGLLALSDSLKVDLWIKRDVIFVKGLVFATFDGPGKTAEVINTLATTFTECAVALRKIASDEISSETRR